MAIKYPFLFPMITNIYLGYLYNKIHNYGNSSKNPTYIRFFAKKMVDVRTTLITDASKSSDGKQILSNNTLSKSSSGPNASAVSSHAKSKTLPRSFYTFKKATDRTILYIKSSFLIIAIAAYFFLLTKNKELKAARSKNSNNGRSWMINIGIIIKIFKAY